MANPNGNPAGKPVDAITQAHGGRRIKIDMRWPSMLIARVDSAARKASIEEGRPVTRTEWTLRAIIAELDRQGVRLDLDVNDVDPRDKLMIVDTELVDEQATCPHPRDARVQLGYMVRCGVCNKRMDR